MALLVLLIITIIVFFIMRLLPGDPLIIYMGQAAQQQAIEEGQIEELRHKFGLDKPLVIQYFNWTESKSWELASFSTGGLGFALVNSDDVKCTMKFVILQKESD